MSNEHDWADWVAKLAPAASAVGTFSAVVTSLWLASRQGRQTRSLQAREQAERVTAWYVTYEGTQDDTYNLYTGLRINNASKQLVYDLIAQVVSLQGSFRTTAVGDSAERNREFGTMVGNVPPGELTTRIDGSGGGMHRRFGIELAFQDAAGRYWLRHGNGKLERIEKHPADLYNLDRPISWER
jgi:hypothetical protein